MKKFLSLGPPFIVIAALLWSFDGLLRRSLFTLPPALIVFWEHVLGLIILIPVIFYFGLKIKKLKLKEWLAIIAVGAFSGAFGTILYTAALGRINFIQFSVVALLQQLQPVWAILAAGILLKEKITSNFLKWAVLAIVASYLITFKDLKVNFSQDLQTIIAASFALGAGIMWGTSTAFSKLVLNSTSFLSATFLRFLIAPLFALIILIPTSPHTNLFALQSSQWITLLAITLSTGMVALLIYYYGLKKTPARVSTLLELTWPASAIFIDYFYFKNPLSVTQLIGVLILFVSMYNVSKLRK